MKNKLAENMLRFGPKNLTESEKRNLSKLVEQAEANAAIDNISLTDAHKNAATPQIIKSNDKPIVSFPTLGVPTNGNKAIENEDGVILGLGGDNYLVIGKIGTLQDDTVVDPKLLALTFYGEPGPGTGDNARFGKAIQHLKLHAVTNLPALTATIAKMMDKNNPARWLKTHGNQLVELYKLAGRRFGINISILDNMTAYNTQVLQAMKTA